MPTTTPSKVNCVTMTHAVRSMCWNGAPVRVVADKTVMGAW
jgi:hypothetical protein